MEDSFIRTKLLIGEEAVKRLQDAKVAVFGIGGVGGHAAEALARSGIGSLSLFDHDTISASNINRQIVATSKTLGRYKVDVMAERIQDINPMAKVRIYRCFYLPETAAQYDLSEYDYILDAIDTVTAKLYLVAEAHRAHVPIISSMGAGNKLDAAKFEVADIYQTSICPLARVMRKECKARGIPSLKVVYSKEPPLIPEYLDPGGSGKRQIPGSMAFVPSVAGLIMAGEVVKDLAVYV